MRNLNELWGINVLGATAVIAAYTEGETWLASLLAYLEGNLALISEYLRDRLPNVKFPKPDALYLAWLDCRVTGEHDASEELPRAAVEAVHRITTDAPRLTHAWYHGLLDDGLEPGQYVELLGTLVALISIDSFCLAIGVAEHPLPVRSHSKHATTWLHSSIVHQDVDAAETPSYGRFQLADLFQATDICRHGHDIVHAARRCGGDTVRRAGKPVFAEIGDADS